MLRANVTRPPTARESGPGEETRHKKCPMKSIVPDWQTYGKTAAACEGAR